MVSTIIRDYLSHSVGVVSFSGDPLIPTMWAHYARNSGFVVGYNTNALRDFGMDFRRILYLELAPVYMPTRDSIIRIRFVDEERRQHETNTGNKPSGTPLLGHDVEFVELKKDLDELVKLLFVKGQAWSYEQEIRLLVDLNRTTRLQSTDDAGFPIHVFEVPAEAIEEVYVGFDTPLWNRSGESSKSLALARAGGVSSTRIGTPTACRSPRPPSPIENNPRHQSRARTPVERYLGHLLPQA